VGVGGQLILWQTGWIVARIAAGFLQVGLIAESDAAVGKKTIRQVNSPVLRPLSWACYIAVSHVAFDVELKLGGEHAGCELRVKFEGFPLR
jgi:hypothetical protein